MSDETTTEDPVQDPGQDPVPVEDIPPAEAAVDDALPPDTAPAEPAVPAGPVTVMCNTDVHGRSGKFTRTKIEQLPLGAQATFVDGRLQIFYPNRNPKSHPGN